MRRSGDAGASLDDVAAALRHLPYRQNLGPYVPASAIEQDLLDDPEFAAVFSTTTSCRTRRRGGPGPRSTPAWASTRASPVATCTPRAARSVMDADVIVVGAGPTGLMLACELCLAGVRPLVLERQPQIRDIPKAGGLSGQILELLRYRGELERFEAAGTAAAAGSHGSRGAGCTWTSPRSPIPRWRCCRFRSRCSSASSTSSARELGAEIRRGQRGGRAEPGRRHGDRGGARPGRARPGDRPISRRLRRGEQPGARPGRHPVPRHHLPGGPAARPGHRARVGDRARERRHRRRGGGQDQLRVHTDRARRVRPRVDRPRAHGPLHQRGGVHRATTTTSR